MNIKRHLNNFLRYKYLLFELVKKNIKLKYRRSYLGILWTLIEPLLTMIVLTLVFGTLFGKDDRTYPVYILCGRLLYSFFSSASKAGLKAVSGNAAMIKKVYVPKYIYVVAAIISNFVTFVISLVVLVGVAAVLRVEPTWHIVEGLIPLVILFVMTLGIGLILATLNVFFRDIEYIWVFNVNPIYMCIANFRNAVLYGTGMNVDYCIHSAIFAVISVIIGSVLFYKEQDKFILYV